MSEPSLEMQKRIVAALKADTELTALVSQRVYDRVPENPAFPYLTITGDEQVLDDGNTCGDAWEVFFSVHAWSKAVGMPEVKQIAGAVRDVLAGGLVLTGFVVVEGLHQDTRYLKDPSPLVQHAVVTFRYLVDPTT